jgi:glycosyltransferase involved in cell wall biosynthesis
MIPLSGLDRDSPKRLLVVHNRYREPGGEDRVFDSEKNLLERHGHDVFSIIADNRTIEGLSRSEVAARTLWNSERFEEVRDLVRRERIQVAHFHNTFPLLSPAVYAAARSAGAAVVKTLHNYRLVCPSAQLYRDGRVCEDCIGRRVAWPAMAHACYRDSRPATGVVASLLGIHGSGEGWSRYIDLFIAPSRFTRDLFLRTGLLPENRVQVKSHFVSPDPGPGSGAGRFVMYLGRLAREKGIPTLLSAAREAAGEFQLKIVGDGPLAGLVAGEAVSMPHVEWLGQLPKEEAMKLLGEAACLVVPSETYETFGMVVIESFARGTPVVVSRHGALAELVRREDNGWTFEPGSTAGLLGGVRNVLNAGARSEELRARARQTFVDQYSGEANYSLLTRAYARALTIRDLRLGLA